MLEKKMVDDSACSTLHVDPSLRPEQAGTPGRSILPTASESQQMQAELHFP